LTREGHLKHLVNTLAVTALLASTASAQGTAVRAAAAPTYEPGIDVQDYAFTLELPDTGSFLRGDATVTLRHSTGVNTLRLDLVDALIVRRVTVNDSMVPVMHVNGRIDIPLPATGDSVRVRVVYDGMVSDGLIVRKDAAGRWTWYGDNWPNRTRGWLPTVDHPSDKATASWTILAPPARIVVANGSLVSRTAVTVRGAPMAETRWREARPIAPYLMVIAAGRLQEVPIADPECHPGDQGQCVVQTVYVNPELADWATGAFSMAPRIMSLFERLIGPFPYEKLAHLQSSTRFGGMENASAIFYDDKLFTTRTLGDGIIAHETAHQWFGDAVTEREWGHLWLSEGFATYFAALWTRSAHGEDAYRAELAKIRERILSDRVVAERPVLDTAQTDYLSLLNANSYQKGGYILYMLHQQLGDSAFFGGLRSYYATYRHGTALTDDLRRELERSSGRSLQQFFDQWLRRPGVPILNVSWTHDERTGAVSIHIVQKGTGGAYELSAPVAITTASGTTDRIIINVPAVSDTVIVLSRTYTIRPRSVVVDPDAQMLARITRS
jgi:aminopeptidase N